MVKMKVGAITIGQSPRTDVVQELLPLMGEQVERNSGRCIRWAHSGGYPGICTRTRGLYFNLATSGRKFGYVCRTTYSAPAAAVYRSVGRAGRKFDSVFVHGRFSGYVSFESAIDFSVQGA